MDDIDRAQEREQIDTAKALEAHLRRVHGQRGHGTETCVECGDAVAPYRQALGARRCVECQTAAEHWERTTGVPR